MIFAPLALASAQDVLAQALQVALPCGYLMTALLFVMAFAGEAEPRVARIRRPMLRGLLVLHLLLFGVHGYQSGGFPRFDVWMSLSSVAFATGLLFVGITFRTPQPTVGAITLPVVGALQMVSSMFARMQVQTVDPAPVATAVHVTTAALACAAIVLSGLYGFLYLLLLRQMKRQTFGAIFQRLPDLTRLAQMTRRSALAGFGGLALGVNIGFAIANSAGTSGFRYVDPTVLLALGVWLHFGLIAFSRRIPGLTAQRASWAAVGGLVVLIATLFLAVVPGATFHALS
ncbi:MAG: cytochrome c biogenesis protein CcsA [Planctomycetota bacterium]|nr:cytochrome c biogenesis protein CcsA [Planctomycetota bacterium]